MTTVVPTLSSVGWAKSPAEKADALLAHFYEADYYQTYLYSGQVTNVQYVMEQYGHDVILVAQQLRESLHTYLSRYYDLVNIDVTSEPMTEPVLTNGYQLRVFCQVTENGKEYSFGQSIVAANSKIEKVIKLNNLELGKLT